MEPVKPAFYNRKEVAKRLNRGTTWLYDNLPKLVANGFPPPDPMIGQFRIDLVEAWIRRNDPQEPGTGATRPLSTDKFLEQMIAQRRQAGRS